MPGLESWLLYQLQLPGHTAWEAAVTAQVGQPCRLLGGGRGGLRTPVCQLQAGSGQDGTGIGGVKQRTGGVSFHSPLLFQINYTNKQMKI